MKVNKNNSKQHPMNCINVPFKEFYKCVKDITPVTTQIYFKNKCKQCNEIFIKSPEIRRLKKKDRKEFYYYCTECLKKRTFIKNYGVDNPSKSEKINKKRAQTNLQKYGTKVYVNSEDFKIKREQTMLELYGTVHALQNEECYKKMVNTMIERYGVDNSFKLDWVRQKAIEKYLENIDEIKLKSYNTRLERYNDGNYNNPDKRLTTMNELYGVDYFPQSDDYKEKVIKTNNKKYGVDWFFQSDEYKEILKDRYNRGYSPNYSYNYNDISFDSSFEVCFYLYYSEIKHKKVLREPIKLPYKYYSETHYCLIDFKIGKTLYEIKGEQFIKRNSKGSIIDLVCPYNHDYDKDYHKKFLCYKKNGVKLITIYELAPIIKKVDEIFGKNFVKSCKID